MDYDPHNPSLDYSHSQEDTSLPSQAPSFSSESSQDPEDSQEFFFFPEETGFTDEGIKYRGYFISYDSGDVEYAKVQGQKPLPQLN